MIRQLPSHFYTTLFLITFISFALAEKYKFCLVDGKGAFKKSGRYCPILDKADSKVECVLGLDRLDCLRKISKGKVDFSVFTPEDLVTASNSEIEILITNELRYTKDNFEYEIVAITSDSKIKSRHDLRNSKFCHPGYGYETDWTNILSNYLEASIVPQSCDPKLTITENRIKASSKFFTSACKAGPWVINETLDEQLKSKYANLCQLCNNPQKCSIQDKYWGRRGSLYCLTDGAGDVTWSRLDDVKLHFGLVPGNMETTPEGYNFVCPDGTVKPVNSTPCVWAVKPWPVIAAKRTSVQAIQAIISGLPHSNESWQSALLNLIETYHLTIEKLEPVEPVEGYLERATGFLNANSFTGCNPPRTIRICTTSIIENAKCSWLRESAAVYGIEPDLDCLKADNTTHCMQAINNNVADLVMVPPNLLYTAIKEYNLTTLFYEVGRYVDEYVMVAITKKGLKLQDLGDFKGRKACFPEFNGIAWHTVTHTLNQKLECPVRSILEFFESVCAPNHNQSSCNSEIYKGDYGAIKCLVKNKGDVAFVSQKSLYDFLNDINENARQLKIDDFNTFCYPNERQDNCHLSWAALGQAMIRSTSNELWIKDTLDVFLQLDSLFGKKFKSLTTPLQIFGLYDGKSDVLFHDVTMKLRDVPYLKDFAVMPKFYNELIKNDLICSNIASKIRFFGVIFVILFHLL